MPFGTADGFNGIFDIFLPSRSLTQAVEGETSVLTDEIEPSLLAEIRIYNLNWEKMSRDNIKIRVLTSLMFVGFFHNSFFLSVFLSFSLPLFLFFLFLISALVLLYISVTRLFCAVYGNGSPSILARSLIPTTYHVARTCRAVATFTPSDLIAT